MKNKSYLVSTRRLFFSLLLFILLVLMGVGILFSQIKPGNQVSRIWADISISFISLILFIPGLFFLIMLILVAFFVSRVNQTLPVWFEFVQNKVAITSTFFISFSNALRKPFILFESIINGFPFLLKRK